MRFTMCEGVSEWWASRCVLNQHGFLPSRKIWFSVYMQIYNTSTYLNWSAYTHAARGVILTYIYNSNQPILITKKKKKQKYMQFESISNTNIWLINM